jgi:hypothetical protein
VCEVPPDGRDERDGGEDVAERGGEADADDPPLGEGATPSPNPTEPAMLRRFEATLTYIGVRVSPVPCSARAPTRATWRAGAVAKMTAR